MKKILKSNYKVVLGVVIGIIISAVGVYAATTIPSSNISYNNSKSGLTATNLNGAIDELYERVNKRGSVELSIGDKVIFGTEKFYILSIADDYVELLAMYNLKVGKNYGSENYDSDGRGISVIGDRTGIQDKNCTGQSGPQQIYDGKSLVEENFFGSTCTDWTSPINSNNYLSNYSSYLENTLGVEIMSIRYPVSTDFLSLGCTEGTDEAGTKMAKNCSKTGYNWLYNTRYFLSENLYYTTTSQEWVTMNTDGTIMHQLVSCGSGHRPIIKVKKSLIV